MLENKRRDTKNDAIRADANTLFLKGGHLPRA